jgi:hypothetical protein
MKRACLLILAIMNLASLAGAQPSGRAAEIQESLQTRYRLTRIGPGVLGLHGGENSIRHAGGVVVLRREGLYGSFKRNQLISMSITGTKVEVLSGSRETAVPLAAGSRFYVVAVSVNSDAVTVGLLSTESITSGAQTGQLWASLNFFFAKELIQRGDVSRIYPEIDEWLLPEGSGIALAQPTTVPAAPMQPNPSQPKMEAAANPLVINLHPGMGRNEVLSLMGNPAREITFGDRRWLQYPGITAVFDKDALTSIDANAAAATMKITSEPEGAEIYIDGALTGTTPSSFNIAAGPHKVSVKQTGFRNWERDIQVLAGSEINFRATLSK